MHESGLLTWGILQSSIKGALLFIIFVNDIVDVLKNSYIIKCAGDTVLYITGNNIEIIKSHLPDDLILLAEWFKENEVILNLKKGKTGAMIFRTAKHLAILNSGLKVKYQHQL